MKNKSKDIEVFQYVGGSICDDAPDWIIEAYEKGILYYSKEFMSELSIKTNHGHFTISKGDYIIKDQKGNIYPCGGYIFEAMFEVPND